jgi:hypothetical protein
MNLANHIDFLGRAIVSQQVAVRFHLCLVQLVMIKYSNYHAARAGAAAITLATDFVDQLNGCAC